MAEARTSGGGNYSQRMASSVSRAARSGNALAESTIGLFKTELIHRHGPWRTFTEVEFATAEWLDWYNHRRLHGALDHTSPAEHETAYYHQHTDAEETLSA
ncbi:transposase InsO family protein [Streptacidiphilus sp. EB103A]